MSRADAKINVKPSPLEEHQQRNMAAEIVSMARGRRGEGYKYSYEFGSRKIADALIDLKQDTYQWHTPQNVELRLIFTAAHDQLIPFIDIKADQSSDEHDAEIVAGGIGQNFVEILVTARNTYWFKYEARYYGRLSWARVPLEKAEQQMKP